MSTAILSSRARRTGLLAAALLVIVAALLPVAAAQAAGAPGWAVHLSALPTNFSVADNSNEKCNPPKLLFVGCDAYQVTATDAGSKPMSAGKEVRLEDTLPAELAPKEIILEWSGLGQAFGGSQHNLGGELCTIAGAVVRCAMPPSFFSSHGGAIQPDQTLTMTIYLTVEGSPRGLLDAAGVSGGGAPEATATLESAVAGPPPFGIASLENLISGEAGTTEPQAGGHPYELTTRIDPATAFKLSLGKVFGVSSVEDPRDISVDLPLGFLGSVRAASTCKFSELSAHIDNGVGGCPTDTIVGHIATEPKGFTSVGGPLYNMTPEHGLPAEFGYLDNLAGAHVLYAQVVPGPQGYVLRTTAAEIPQIQLSSIVTRFYGDPAARDGAGGAADVPFFTNPSDCNGEPLVTRIYTDSWQHPGTYNADGTPNLSDPNWRTATSTSPPVSGCNALTFAPRIQATAETDRADAPSGLDVAVEVPQSESVKSLATPPLKRAVVALPEGMAVNPSSANGLQACSLQEVGMSSTGLPDAAPPHCPDASKIGTLELETPDLPGVLKGQIYVARPGENPFGTLLAIYLVVDDPATGVVVKIPGEVRADPTTGQLTTVVDDGPQFPFSALRTHFFGGSRAPLRTPAICGADAVTATLTPWSAPESGPPVSTESSFEISQAAGGGSCPTAPAAEPNHPSFTAGTLSTQAGAYSPFVLHLARSDGEQPIAAVDATLPKGLLGRLAGISYCPESAIALARSREHEGGGAEELASPACPTASEVGVVHVGAGAGAEPYYVSGHAYLAGPYKGAPLSLVIVTPAIAGPFDLGDVLVRAALNVDPFTTQITAVSDPIPTILDGIPLDLRSINLEMSRHEFTLNPTNCEKTAITGAAAGQFGATAALTQPFQVGGCKALAFKPKLRISLAGSTKRARHPALKAVLTYPQGPGYANIAYAQVGLPGTEFLAQGNLNHVCTQAELKSASCPKSSIYGTAKAWSPLLEAPLEGNVYLGVGFGYTLPALVAELNGQIRVLLVGKVDTDKEKGVRSTFEVVPDAPVSRFVLTMKGGPKYGLLENTEGVCAKPQKAAVKFVAQNGIAKDYKQKIENGCGKKGKGRKHKGKGGRHKSVASHRVGTSHR